MRSEPHIIEMKAAPVGLQRQIDCSKMDIHVNFSFIWCQIGPKAHNAHISPTKILANIYENFNTTPALM